MSKIKLRLVSSFTLIVLSFFSFAQNPQTKMDSVVIWKKIDEINKLMLTEPRPIVTFFYIRTDDSCRLMYENSLNKREIAKFINTRFYPVMIDAQTTDTIHWFDKKTYVFDSVKQMNTIMYRFLGKDPKVPALLLYNLDTKGYTFKGYKSRYEMRCILAYINEEVDKTTPYELWEKAYRIAFPPIGLPAKLNYPIKWIPLDEALALQKKAPRPLFINWYARLNISSYVMRHIAFEEPKVADYLNKHFYCVNMDAQTTDTLFWDKPYYNEPEKGKFNQLALEQLNNSMKFPSLLFYDRQRKLILMQQTYLGPLNFLALINYVGSGSYLKTSLKEYLKTFKADF